jgi:glycosyltransferase involved in cell wall biosynthesis
MQQQKQNIAIIVSSPMTAKVFLSHQLRALASEYDVTLVANIDGEDMQSWLPNSVAVVDISISRSIRPWKDLMAFFKLYRLFKTSQFALVHSVSPKAGLLTMLASRFAKVPNRIHTFTGQVWATKKGFFRWMLRAMDRVTANCATTVLVDSFTQRDFLVVNTVVSEAKSMVLCNGSISGVDCERFKPSKKTRKDIRVDLGTSEETVAMIFVGRLKKEKGVTDLVDAFTLAKQSFSNMELWLVGPDEEHIEQTLGNKEGVRYISYTDTPESYMAAADVLCLPSYREGFGSVVIEAAACGIPSIGSDIYGLQDAIIEGETGLLVEKQSMQTLINSMVLLAENRTLRLQMGDKAIQRATTDFSQDRLTASVLDLYHSLMAPCS